MRLRFAQRATGMSLEPDPWTGKNQPGVRSLSHTFIIADDPKGPRTNMNDNTSNLRKSYLIKAHVAGTYSVKVQDSTGAAASFNLRVN